MTFKLVDAALPLETFKEVLTDGALRTVYLSQELCNQGIHPEPEVILRDETILASGDVVMVRDLLPGSWLLVFQVGDGAGALPIALASTMHAEHFQEHIQSLFDHPEVTITTERLIFSEHDTSIPIGKQTSSTTVPSSFLRIFAFRADHFQGSWFHTPEYQESLKKDDGTIQTFLDFHKDGHDKTL